MTEVRRLAPVLACGGDAYTAGVSEVRRPWDGQLIGEVGTLNAAGAERAVADAAAVYRDRSAWLPPARRIEILEQVCAMLDARSDEMALQAAAEGGKPLIDSKVEVARAVVTLRSCIDYLRSAPAHGSRIPMGINAASMNRLAYTVKEPIGAVLAFSAFNHPVNLIAHQIGPAIAAGCPVVVKPAEATPLSCFDLVAMFHAAGLPKTHCQTALFEDRSVLTQLVSDPRIGFFSFIGSAKVGWSLRGKLAPGVRCAFEHGGAAPVIIAADADLEGNLPLIAKGGFYHAGQVCVSVQRVFAHASIAPRVAEELAKLAAAMKVGDPTLDDTEVGPLIRPGEVDRVEQWIAQAVDAGAGLVCGGGRVSERACQCTVLTDPPAVAEVSREEIFGPVVCVYSFDEVEDAIERANALPFSFQASVITRDVDTAMQCVNGLDAAAVMVNDHTAFRVDWMPFAGHKHSGYGTGGTPYTIDDMQAEKLVVIRSRWI